MQPATQTTRAISTGVRPIRSLQPSTPSTTLAPADFLTRGPLAARAHRLLGLGPVGGARLGQGEPALRNAFGGDVASWQQVGTPWIAARSLARPTDSLPSQSTVGWLLSQ